MLSTSPEKGTWQRIGLLLKAESGLQSLASKKWDFQSVSLKEMNSFKKRNGVLLLYNVVLVSAVQKHESAISTYISLSSWASLPPSHPTPLGHHRSLSWAPCAVQELCINFTHGSVYIYITFSIHPTLPFPHCEQWLSIWIWCQKIRFQMFFSCYVTQGQLLKLYGSSFLPHQMRMIVVSTYPTGLTSTLNELI